MGSQESKPRFGHHVLNVEKGSPAEQAGIQCFFDFIVAANGVIMDREDKRPLIQVLSQNIGKQVFLLVYNSKDNSTREVKVTPNDSWGGEGLLGARIRFCNLSGANEHVWHVLEVYPESPAAAAGLERFADYIVGTNDLLFSDSEDFFTLVQANMGTPTALYVYNIRTDAIRQVVITPNQEWGGSGSLGCDVGYGYLHRIPHNREAALHRLMRDHPLPKGTTNETPTTTTNTATVIPNESKSQTVAEDPRDATEAVLLPVSPPSPESSAILTTTTNSRLPSMAPRTLSFSSQEDDSVASFQDITGHGTNDVTTPMATKAPSTPVTSMSFHPPPGPAPRNSYTPYYSGGATPTLSPSISTLPTLMQPSETYDGIETRNIKFPEDET